MILLNTEMSPSLIMQYVIVATIIAAAILWIIVKNVNRKRQRNGGGCSGCALSEACNSAEKKSSKPERCSDRVSQNQAGHVKSGVHDE